MHNLYLPDEQQSWLNKRKKYSEDINLETKSTQRIYRSKMTFNSSNFLFKNFMPESSFKLSLTERCRRNVHRILTTTKQHLNGV